MASTNPRSVTETDTAFSQLQGGLAAGGLALVSGGWSPWVFNLELVLRCISPRCPGWTARHDHMIMHSQQLCQHPGLRVQLWSVSFTLSIEAIQKLQVEVAIHLPEMRFIVQAPTSFSLINVQLPRR